MSTTLLLGANGALGTAIAHALAVDCDHLVVAARDADRLATLADEVRSAHGTECTAVPVDARDDAAVAALVERANERLDLRTCVNAQGVAHRPAPLGELPVAQLDEVLAVTFRSVAVALHHQLRVLPRGGSVTCVASTAALRGVPGMAAYAAAKHAVVGLVRSSALDYGPAGIRVNAVAPGPVDSGGLAQAPEEHRRAAARGVALDRLGAPQEVADAVAWLAGPRAGFITGAVVEVDGGRR